MGRSRVDDVMTTDVVTVFEDTVFKEIVDVLTGRGVSTVPVVDGARRVLGVVSEADLLHKLDFAGEELAVRLLEGRGYRPAQEMAAGDTAGELMKSPAVTVPADMTVMEAARVMLAEEVKRLPVVDQAGTLVGIVARRDLLAAFLQPDLAIRDEVIEQVFKRAMWVDPTNVTVEVHDGMVTLAGELDRKSLLPVAVRLTRGVDGVIDVDDRLAYHYDDTAELSAFR